MVTSVLALRFCHSFVKRLRNSFLLILVLPQFYVEFCHAGTLTKVLKIQVPIE